MIGADSHVGEQADEMVLVDDLDGAALGGEGEGFAVLAAAARFAYLTQVGCADGEVVGALADRL